MSSVSDGSVGLVSPSERSLTKSLSPRHLSMIALGGAIGAGLLVASSTAITVAGPAVILSYVFAGVILTLVMRMLGELSSASPQTGSFSAYAHRFIGAWAGFTVGWLYWWFWAVTVAIEATAAATIISGWFPAFEQWAVAGVLVLALTLLNLVSVRVYGESEFWFSSVKVFALGLLIVLGVLALVGVIPHSSAGLFQLVGHGGFFPHGVGAVFSALLAVIFSMFGAEIVTIAAGESTHPRESVVKAVRAVLLRILIFYIGAIAVTLCVVPWTSIVSGVSPFVTVFESFGVPYAAVVMNIVVLTALISCLNASLYSSSRMLFAMASRGDAPRFLGGVSSVGSPWVAVIFSSCVGVASVLLNYFMPDAVFSFLVNTTGATGIFVWLFIAVSHLRSRRILLAEGVDVTTRADVLKMWAFPYLNWVLIVVLVALLLFMGVSIEHRYEVLISTGVAVVVVFFGWLRSVRVTR
ncbi:amino acid permease [Rothia sp. P13129]|uniref:amino acid permease n=1 Tax=Rothia sp. P13129 TaxID=3402664 RepID=UPI003AD4380A